ncbi:MAG: Ig-like domain-containing protein, partial [Anaerolineales bacterium]
EGTPVAMDVAANDTDPDGNLDSTTVKTSCAGCADPTSGSLLNNGDGTFDYTPNPGFTGSDSFVYEVCDTDPTCDTATVSISVNASAPTILSVDAVSSGTNAGASLSIPHTTSGSNRLMLVGVSINNALSETVTSISYGAQSLTLDGAFNHQGSGGDDARIEIWSLVAPIEGTADVVITFSADLRKYAVAGVMTLNGVDQDNSLGTFVGNYGDANSASVTAPTGPDDLLFGVFACETCTSVSFDSPGVGQWNEIAGGGSTIGAGGTVEGSNSISASLGKGDHWAMGGISIKPAP